MTKKLPKVCVIILSWNHVQNVLETLSLLSNSNTDGIKMDIVLVNNGSTDGTSDIVQNKFSKVKIIENSTNLGFSEGNNVGMRYALKKGYDYISLLNDDTLVDKNLVKNIVEVHEKYEEVGAISPKIYFAKGFEFHKERYGAGDLGKVIWYAGGLIEGDNVYGTNRGVDEVDRGQYDKEADTDFATGCFVIYKAKALESVGLYDPRYFLYFEDTDHSQRLKKKGYRVLYSPAGKLWHKVSQSSGVGSEHNDYYLTRNRMLFGLTYASLRTKVALIRESIKLLLNGRPWQRIGVRDYYLGRFGKGSWQ